MALIRAHHKVYGWHLVPEGKVRLHPDDWSTFDPAEHTVTEVVDHLRAASPEERERVLELERSQPSPRKTVLVEEDKTPAPGAGDTTTQTGAVPGTSTEE